MVAVSNALKLNLNIYQCNGNTVQYVQKPCLLDSDRYIFLKYDRQGGAFHGFDHYAAVVNKKIKDEDITNTPLPKTNIDPKISPKEQIDTKQARETVAQVCESDGYESSDYCDTYSIASDSKSMALINAEIQTAMSTTNELCDGFGKLFRNKDDFDDHQDILWKLTMDSTNSTNSEMETTNSEMETTNSEMETSGSTSGQTTNPTTSSKNANQFHADENDVIIIEDESDVCTVQNKNKKGQNRSEPAMSVESTLDDDDDDEYSFPNFPKNITRKKGQGRKSIIKGVWITRNL